MQPVLSGVSQQIRAATLEAEGDDSSKAVEQADREFSEEIADQESSDRVDVGESLETVETPVRQEVIDEAKLDAWQSHNHPDLVDVSETEYAYTEPFETSGLEAFLVGNDTLSEEGITFSTVRELDIDLSESEYTDAVGFEDAIYRLNYSGLDVPEADDEHTLAETVSPDEDTVAVTFSSECADEFPSVHYLAPGNPLFRQLLEVIRETSEEPTRLSKRIEVRDKSNTRSIICGWGRDGDIATLGPDGAIEESRSMRALTSWKEVFLANRERTDPF